MPLTWLRVLSSLLTYNFFPTRSPDDADSVETMSDVHNHVVETERIGKLHVYVQGWTDWSRAHSAEFLLSRTIFTQRRGARNLPRGLISD